MFQFKTHIKYRSLNIIGLLILALVIPVTFNSCKGFEVAPTEGVEGEQDNNSLTTPLQNLQGVAVSESEVRLTYSLTSTGNYAFSIFRDDQYIATTVNTNFTDVGLTPGTTYTYKVYAADKETGKGHASGVIVLSTPGSTLPTPQPTPDPQPQPIPPEPEPTPPPTNQKSIAMYSYNSDLSNAKVLNSAVLERQKIYLFFLNESNYKQIRFYCCKGLSGKALYDTAEVTIVEDTAAPFLITKDLSKLLGGERELYVDAALNDSSGRYESISTVFTLKEGAVTQPVPIPDPQPQPPPIDNESPGWTVVKNFNNGPNGSVAMGSDAFDGDAKRSYYSNVQAREGAYSAELNIQSGKTAFGSWGGVINFPKQLARGDEMWISLEMYIPSSFKIATNTGSLKFMRLRQKNADGSHTGYLDNLIRMPDQTSGVFTLLKEGQHKLFHYGERGVDDLPYDKWFRYEMYVKFDNVPKDRGGSANVKAWLNDKLITDEDRAMTITNSGVTVNGLYLFTYWNGGAPKDQKLYVDNIIMTTKKPLKKDNKGNLMIGNTLP